jgi:hypothetical protein
VAEPALIAPILRIVNGDVQVANAWRYFKSAFTKYRHHAQIFSPILNEDTS